MIDDLRVEFAKGNVLLVVGAGVSILATDNASVSSWRGLLRNGISRVLSLRRCSSATAARIAEQVDSDDLVEMLSAATFVSQKLGAPADGEFRSWLRETVGDLVPTQPAVIEALRATGAMILTTNYDSLIERAIGTLPVTWQQSDRCERILRGNEKAVIHIHGHWESPETVILGQDSYALISSDERVQSFIRAAHLSKTFVYVGFGDGLSDPNFAKFLEWSERYFSGSQTRRYRLVRESELNVATQKHPAKQRIQILSYGKEHQDLVPFLGEFRRTDNGVRKIRRPQTTQRYLLPNKAPEPRFELRGIDWYEERDAAFLHGRAADIDHLKQLLAAYPIIRLVAPSGTGKSSLLRAGLVPALRKLGWRAVVIRPYDDPANIVGGELTRAMLDDRSGPFGNPIDNDALRREVVPLLEAEECPCLVVIIDQVEDVFSPSAPRMARAWLRDLLRELHRCCEITPLLKTVVSYRTDAEAQLGRLWQEASGNPAGFPYHTLLGITIEDAAVVIAEVAARLEWKLEVSPGELASELRVESRAAVQDTFVFPPYLQILLSTIASERDTTAVDAAFIQRLGGVRGIIATYLRRVVDEVEKKGGDYTYVRKVLQAVCRSSGEKLRQTSAEIAESAGLTTPVARLLLTELVAKRLVRPLGGDSYEIQHDRFAEVIISELDPGEKESKQAIELLLSKSASFDATRALLTTGELQLLFRHRAKLPARYATDRLLITSTLQAYQEGPWPPVGWIWTRSKSLEEVLERLIDTRFAVRSHVRKTLNRALAQSTTADLDFLIRIAAKNVCNLRDGALEAIAHASNRANDVKLRDLLKHDDEKLRRAAALALREQTDRGTRKLLRKLAISDSDYGVRRAAMEALRKPSNATDFATLHLIAARNKGEQARRAVEILGENPNPNSIVALKSLLNKTSMRTLAARILLRQPSEAASTTAQILQSDDWRLKAVLAEESRSLELLGSLARERAETVRRAALKTIGLLGTPAAYDWLVGEMQRAEISPHDAILRAIATSGHPKALDLLVSIAEGETSYASNAVDAIRTIGTVDAVNYLLEQSTLWEPDTDEGPSTDTELYDPDSGPPGLQTNAETKPPENPWYSDIAVAIKAISDRTALPELRGWSQSSVTNISIAAIETYARLSEIADRSWMLSLLEKSDDRLQPVILSATQGVAIYDANPILKILNRANPAPYDHRQSARALQTFLWYQTDCRSIPALRELCTNSHGLVRAGSIAALSRFSDPADLPLFIELISKGNDDAARASAIDALGRFDDSRARETLRSVALGSSQNRYDAADVFSRVAPESEKTRLLDECVERGKFDIAGIIDFYLNAPPWWRSE